MKGIHIDRKRHLADEPKTGHNVICSVAVDLRISNVVDLPNVVVSALLPEAIFSA